MAENGYSDGSVIVSTDLDTKGFEAGSDRIRNAIDSSEDKFRELGDTLKDAMDTSVKAAQEAAPLIDQSLQESVNSFKSSSDDIQGYIDKWADAMPEKKFESSLNAIGKMLDGVSIKFSEVEQAYRNAADGGSKEVAKFETKATSLETSLDKVCNKISEIYGVSVKTQSGELFSAKSSDDLMLLISKFDDLQNALATMQTEIVKVKAETEKAKAAEIAAMEKVKAETDAAKESTRKLADENKQAWQTVKQEIKTTETETKAFDSSSSALEKSITALENKLFALGPAAKKAMGGSESAIDSFDFKVANAQRTIQYLRERLEALGNTQVTTNEYDELNSSLEQARAALNSYLAEKQRMLNNGTNKESEEWQTAETAIVQLQVQIQQYEASLERLRTNGGAVIEGTNTAAYEDLSNKLMQAENELANYEAAVAKANSKTHILSATLKAVGKVGVSAFKLLGNSIANAVSKMKSFHKPANDSMAAVKKLTKTFTSFGTRIKSLLKRRLIHSMISGAIEGIKNLAQISPQVNSAMSAIKTSLSQLKNSFGTAFAPILTAVAPILTKLIDLLSVAFTKIGMLIAALTGAKSFKRAVTVQQDYAASLNNTAKAADKAQKSLAGFDELNNTNSSTSNNQTVADPTTMFEEIPIDSKLTNFADKLKKAFLSGDFEGIGAAVASKVNGIFKKINKVLDNEKITSKVVNFVSGLTKGFNRFITDTDFEQIGSALGKGINKVVDVIYAFWMGIDWKQLGKSLTDGLNGLVKKVNWSKLGKLIGARFQGVLSFLNGAVTNFDFNALAEGITTGINNIFGSIDWAMLGQTLSTAVKKLFNAITTFAKTVNWSQIGKDVATFLNNIDWAGVFGSLAQALSSVLSGLLDTLISFVSTLDWAKLGKDLWDSLVAIITNIKWGELITKAFTLLGAALAALGNLFSGLIQAIWNGIKNAYNGLKDYFSEKIEDCGGNIILGILKGIVDALVGIGKWIYDHIFKPIWDGICSVFGIHSPSTKMMEIGKDLILGLLKGLKDLVVNVLKFFGQLALDILGALASLPGKLFDLGKTLISKLWEGIKSVGSTLINGIGTVAGWIWDGLKALPSKLWNLGKDIVSGIWNGMKSVGSTLVNGVTSVAGWVWDGLKSLPNKVLNLGKNIVSGLWDGMKSVGSTLKSGVTTVAGWIKDGISGLGSKAVEWGKDIVGGIKSGLSKAGSALKSAVSSVAGGIKKFLGFSEPEEGPLSDFHTYMPDMIKLMVKGIEDNKKHAINAVADLASGISDEAQDARVLIPIDAENKYTHFLDNFADRVSEAFINLINKLEAIAGNVTFAVPAVAAGTVIPYSLKTAEYSNGDKDDKSVDLVPITSRIDRVVDKLDEVVDAIDNKETGITDEAVYNSVKKSVRKETKSTGRNPFTD